ncbi:arginase family protein [Nonomuraea sp. LP-02]|uniref:arginase family protein n=1 Tax=Nonomuraea sp. LP-02 TaxID=3097960 RepID=UPI002E367ECB|nr:arginase family protein [Nonomuraea sp. LP-02]MED7929616.1 arginase family protein [Nonomuraea sp. LP-02]
MLRKVAVVEVPQWRGSGSRTAERLREGARVVADLVNTATVRVVGEAPHRVRVAVEDGSSGLAAARLPPTTEDSDPVTTATRAQAAGEDDSPAATAAQMRAAVEDGGPAAAAAWVRAAVGDGSLGVVAARVRAAVEGVGDGVLVVVVGGDCGVELEPVSAARRRYGDRLVVVWFDAHGDLNTPESSPSGAYHGMVLRALTGEGPEGLAAEQPLEPRRIVLAGVRDLDPPEAAFVTQAGIRWVTMAATETAEALLAAIEAAGGPDAAVYVHIDLDVLDPEVFRSVGCPTPGGMHPERLLSLVTAIGGRFEVAGLGLMEYEAGDLGDEPDVDREVLAELVGGVVAAVAGHPGRTAPR